MREGGGRERGREGEGREGGSEGGELCDLVSYQNGKVYWENKKLKQPMRKENKRKRKGGRKRRRWFLFHLSTYLIPKRSFFASPCADMISTCKHSCVQEDE